MTIILGYIWASGLGRGFNWWPGLVCWQSTGGSMCFFGLFVALVLFIFVQWPSWLGGRWVSALPSAGQASLWPGRNSPTFIVFWYRSGYLSISGGLIFSILVPPTVVTAQFLDPYYFWWAGPSPSTFPGPYRRVTAVNIIGMFIPLPVHSPLLFLLTTFSYDLFLPAPLAVTFMPVLAPFPLLSGHPLSWNFRCFFTCLTAMDVHTCQPRFCFSMS